MIRLIVPWAIVAAGTALYSFNTYKQSTPPEDWMDVASVTVHPTFVGRAALMTVERRIKKPFVGEWSATVRRSTIEGFEVACTASGAGEYRMDSVLPKKLDLDWWTHPIKCDLPRGTYRLDTVWTIKPEGYPEKFLKRSSNLFEVRPFE